VDPEAVRSVGRAPHGGSDDPTLLEFSANVNPRTPPGVEDVYRAALAGSRRYPAEPPAEFRAAAAASVGCAPEQVVPTAGGLAAIRLSVETTVSPGDSVLVPAPSFAEYAREVRLAGGTPAFVDHDRLVEADPAGHAMAVVCNPNNPTGDACEDDRLRAFAARCRDAGTTLLVDEAFLGYTDRPSMAGEPGVVVARSLTKLFGLPGLRAGYAVATGGGREALETARRPWNVGTPALRVGAHCLRRTDFVEETRRRVRRERARMRERLSARYVVAPSAAPFLLLDVGERDPAAVVAGARERGVAIRDATTFRGLDRHVRVAVRSREANDRLLTVLADV